MPIIKIEKKDTEPFVILKKASLQDIQLSWKAKGLLSYLLSLPHDWKINVTDLKNRATDGRDATSTGLNELVTAGYITKVKNRNSGKFDGYSYTVYQSPLTDKPETDKPSTENHELLSTNTSNTINSIIEETSSSVQTSKDNEYLELIKRCCIDTKVFQHRIDLSNPSKLILNTVQLLKDIQSGKFLIYNFKDEWIEKQNINTSRITGITNITKLEKLLKLSVTRFNVLRNDPEYSGPKNYFKNTTLPGFLFNERTGVSMFLKCISHKPKKSREVQVSSSLQKAIDSLKKINPDVNQLTSKVYNISIIKKWDDSDQLAFYNTLYDLIEWRKDNVAVLKTLSDGWSSHFGTLNRFLGTVGRFLDINSPKPYPRFLQEQGINWKSFVYWCRDDLGVEISIPRNRRK